MDYRKESEEFEKWKKKYGNPYAAIVRIAEQARRICTQYDNIPLHSECISYVLLGEKIGSLETAKNFDYDKKFRHIASDILENVTDKQVVSCVQRSITQSKKANHLKYMYNQNLDSHQKARVRILNRIIWESIQISNKEDTI